MSIRSESVIDYLRAKKYFSDSETAMLLFYDTFADGAGPSLCGWRFTNPSGFAETNGYTYTGSIDSTLLQAVQFNGTESGYAMQMRLRTLPPTSSACEIHKYLPYLPGIKRIYMGGAFTTDIDGMHNIAPSVGAWTRSGQSGRGYVWRFVKSVYFPHTGEWKYDNAGDTPNNFGYSQSDNLVTGFRTEIRAATTTKKFENFLIGWDAQNGRYAAIEGGDVDIRDGDGVNYAGVAIGRIRERRKMVGYSEAFPGKIDFAIETAQPTYPRSSSGDHWYNTTNTLSVANHRMKPGNSFTVTSGGPNEIFASSTFTMSSDTATLSGTLVMPHGLRVRVTNSGGALPTGLVAGTDYYCWPTSGSSFKLYASLANAVSQTSPVGSGAGTGTHTVTPQAYFCNNDIGSTTPTSQETFFRAYVDQTLATENPFLVLHDVPNGTTSIRVTGGVLDSTLRSLLAGRICQFMTLSGGTYTAETTTFTISSVTDNSDGTYTVALSGGTTGGTKPGGQSWLSLGCIDITGTAGSFTITRSPGQPSIFFPYIWAVAVF